MSTQKDWRTLLGGKRESRGVIPGKLGNWSTTSIHPTKEMLAGSQGIASKEVYQGKFGWWSLEAVEKYFSGMDILNRRTYVSRVFKAEGYKLGSSLNWDLGHPSYPGLTISVEPGKKQGQ